MVAWAYELDYILIESRTLWRRLFFTRNEVERGDPEGQDNLQRPASPLVTVSPS